MGTFGQSIGGFASPQTGFGGTKLGTGLSGGLGGLGAKTSPSAFSVGGSLGGGFTGSVAQQPGAFGGTPGFGSQPQQQVSTVSPRPLSILYCFILSLLQLYILAWWRNVRRYDGQ